MSYITTLSPRINEDEINLGYLGLLIKELPSRIETLKNDKISCLRFVFKINPEKYKINKEHFDYILYQEDFTVMLKQSLFKLLKILQKEAECKLSLRVYNSPHCISNSIIGEPAISEWSVENIYGLNFDCICKNKNEFYFTLNYILS